LRPGRRTGGGFAYVGDIAESFSDGRGSHGCTGLHVTNVDGTHDRLLAAAPRLPDGFVVVWTPAWSPDGRWIAFAHPIEHFGGMDLYVISPDGTHLRRLTHRRNLINSSPTWSADGERIAFAFGGRDRGGPGPGGPDQIRAVVVIDRDGSHRHTILRVRADMHLAGGPAWQPR
jgi:WD40-like Beta Propeller Repeat